MIDLERIKRRILRGEEIEKILEEVDWKEFEEFVIRILEEHEFNTFHNFRFKTERRYEIDILAVRDDLLLVIDCKKWKRGRYKKTGLKYAVQTQVKRINELKKFLKNNTTLQNKLKLDSNDTEFVPLIVTWFEEELLEHDGVLIVPVWKLNQFLLSLSEYI
jgi:Holliday junction resolvase-like predicted endonuclease